MNTTAKENIQFGIHFMLDGYGCSKEMLEDKESLKNMLTSVPVAMGMHTISEPLVVEVGPKNRKDPGGLSGFVLIAESHISFHTFPSRGFVTIDVYTCQNDMNTEKLRRQFVDVFKMQDSEMTLVNRGTRYPVDDIY